jgi:hypothetical protein
MAQCIKFSSKSSIQKNSVKIPPSVLQKDRLMMQTRETSQAQLKRTEDRLHSTYSNDLQTANSCSKQEAFYSSSDNMRSYQICILLVQNMSTLQSS